MNVFNYLKNPFYIVDKLLMIDVDESDNTPYLSIIYKRFYDIFKEIFRNQEYLNTVSDILEKNMSLQEFIYFIRDNFELIMNCYKVAIYYIPKGDSVDMELQNFRKLYINTKIDSDTLLIEISNANKNNLVSQYQVRKVIADFLANAINEIIYVLYHREELENEVRNGEKKMSKKKNHTEKEVEFFIDDNGDMNFDVVHKEVLEINDGEKKNKKELRKNVNKLDEDQGCDLKKPKQKYDDYGEYNRLVNKYRKKLAKKLFTMNGISLKKNILDGKIFGTEIRHLEIDGYFRNKSVIFTNKSVDLDSQEFRERFCSYICSWVALNLEKIAEVSYKVNKDGLFIEYDMKIEYVQNVYNRTRNMIKNIEKGELYSSDLIYFEGLMNYIENPKKDLKKNVNKTEKILSRNDLMKVRLGLFGSVSHSEGFSQLLNLVYMICTNDPKKKDRILCSDSYNFFQIEETYKMIQKLGKRISDDHRKNGTPLLFKFFMACNPNLYSISESVVEKKNYAIGCIALRYYGFLTEDETFDWKLGFLG